MTKIKEAMASLRAVGRRKSASARVAARSGTGLIIINGKPLVQFFPYFQEQQLVTTPLRLLSKLNDFDWSIKVAGGGVNGQAVAIQLGLARCLLKINPEWRKTLRTAGLLTRDPRVKERKKPGLKKARRAPQWSKR